MGGWPKYWIKARDGQLLVGDNGTARYESPDALIDLALATESLASLKKQYPAPTRHLLAALSAFRIDFHSIIKGQIENGASNLELAALHKVDAKWIAEIRLQAGATRQVGRLTKKSSGLLLITKVTVEVPEHLAWTERRTPACISA